MSEPVACFEGFEGVGFGPSGPEDAKAEERHRVACESSTGLDADSLRAMGGIFYHSRGARRRIE